MATADFYVLLEPEFSDAKRQNLKKVKAVSLKQRPPDPSTTGLWVRMSVEVPDGVFTHLVPHIAARIEAEQMEVLLQQTSLHARLIDNDDDDA